MSYRGVRIGQVKELVLTDDGVDVLLDIDNEFDDIPADAHALVGNRSAVGEQYVELQPQSDDGPFLEDGSEIARDRTDDPDPDRHPADPPRRDGPQRRPGRPAHRHLRVRPGLQRRRRRPADRSSTAATPFITAAEQNFDVTVDLIRDSNTVLNGQIDSERAFRRFARDLSVFTTTVADHDHDLRTLIEDGSLGANELRVFLEDNEVELGELINNLVTTGEVVVKHLDGIEQLLVIYPYVVEGGYTVVSRSPGTGLYDAHFGMVLTTDPHVCLEGYEGTDRRSPLDGSNAR